jgi:hypothetical protein
MRKSPWTRNIENTDSQKMDQQSPEIIRLQDEVNDARLALHEAEEAHRVAFNSAYLAYECVATSAAKRLSWRDYLSATEPTWQEFCARLEAPNVEQARANLDEAQRKLAARIAAEIAG